MKSKTISKETLESLNADDITPRIILSHDLIAFKCYKCSVVGTRDFSEAKRCFNRYGFAFQCPSCLKLKYKDRGPEWLKNVQAAAQSPDHKARAAKNGKTRLLLKNIKNVKDFWDFGNVDIQLIAGSSVVSASCLQCSVIESKPLKRFIEACNNITHGCSNCWSTYTSTNEYKQSMSQISTRSGHESRDRQKEGLKSFWDSTSDEYKKMWSDQSKKIWENKTPEEILEYGNKISDLWHNQPEDLKQAKISRRVAVLSRWAEENPEKLYASKTELEILNWITKELKMDAKKYRSDGQEIDIFIPSLNIGIEYNGLYWHSELQKDKNYHKNKTDHFANKGIRIIHVFEHLWKNRKIQFKSYIKSALGVNANKIGARKCDLRSIEAHVAKDFLEQNHIQGFPVSVLYSLGLFYNNQMVAVATFGHHHRGKDDIVLNRFAGLDNWTVSGGLSRISKAASDYFKRDIITWADISISAGSGYEKARWEKQEILPPDYFYTDFKNVINKQSRRKSLVGTPEEITEHEHANSEGLFKVYDCGKIRYVFKHKG